MRIRVLTYNIHKAIDLNRRFQIEPIAEIIRHHDADIVLLQEVTVGVPRFRSLHLGEELARMCGYPFETTAVNVHYHVGGGYGNATLSRLPIRRRRNVDLTVGWHKARGALFTNLELPGSLHRLQVFNVHLGLSRVEREMQVIRLLATDVIATARERYPTVIGGDFNDWRNLLEPRRLRPAGFTCATRHGRLFGIRTYPTWSPLGALDKVFVRGGIDVVHATRSRTHQARVASDHLPVVVDLEVRH